MAHPSSVSTAITAVTAACSLLSVIGSAFILVCYAILPLDHHFRHILILNLATSDFLNSLNNTAAGLYILSHKKGLDPGPACIFNGFVGQVTVQATDCAILAITITTVYVITRRGPISTVPQGGWRLGRIALLCCIIWVLPFFTGFLALSLGWYAPATGNWCWITAKPVYLRYVLTHGWRFLFICIEISLYIYLDIHLRRHYRTVAEAIPSSEAIGPRTSRRDTTYHSPLSESPVMIINIGEKNTPDASECIGPRPVQSTTSRRDTAFPSPLSESPVMIINMADKNTPESTSDAMSSTHSPTHGLHPASVAVPQNKSPPHMFWSFSRITGLRGTNRVLPGAFSADAQYQAIQRALLLNAYPLAYILLWLPGIANRLIEAAGHTSQVMQFLQATTQLVGLANALTYGWNEKVAKQLRERFQRR